MEFRDKLKEWLDETIHLDLCDVYNFIRDSDRDVYTYYNEADMSGAISFLNDYLYDGGYNENYKIELTHDTKYNVYKIIIIQI